MTKLGTPASKGQDEDGGEKCVLCGDDTSLTVHCLLVMKLEKVHFKSRSLCAGRLLIYYEKDQSGGLFMHLRVTEEQQQRRHGQQSYQKIHRCKCGVFCTLPGCRA